MKTISFVLCAATTLAGCVASSSNEVRDGQTVRVMTTSGGETINQFSLPGGSKLNVARLGPDQARVTYLRGYPLTDDAAAGYVRTATGCNAQEILSEKVTTHNGANNRIYRISC